MNSKTLQNKTVQFGTKKNKCWLTCSFNVDNINNLMQNEKITVLVNKKNELMKNPEIKPESIDTAYRGAVGCRKQAFLQGWCRKSVPTL